MASSLLGFALTRARNFGLVMAPFGGGLIAPFMVQPRRLVLTVAVWLVAFIGLIAMETLREATRRQGGYTPASPAGYAIKSTVFTLAYWGMVIVPIAAVIILSGMGNDAAGIWFGLAILAGLQPAMAVLDYVNARRRDVSKTRHTGALTE